MSSGLKPRARALLFVTCFVFMQAERDGPALYSRFPMGQREVTVHKEQIRLSSMEAHLSGYYLHELLRLHCTYPHEPFQGNGVDSEHGHWHTNVRYALSRRKRGVVPFNGKGSKRPPAWFESFDRWFDV